MIDPRAVVIYIRMGSGQLIPWYQLVDLAFQWQWNVLTAQTLSILRLSVDTGGNLH
ncbi:hypothetical protein LguiA_013547 [Lonicera macranthoides]